MLAIIERYRVILIILGILTLIVALSWFFLRPSFNKVPSRGIFVVNNLKEHYTISNSIYLI